MWVAVDLDDTVLSFVPEVLRTFAKEYGETIPYAGVPWGQDIVEFTRHPKFQESGYRDWWGWLKDRDWLWSTFDAVDGAIGGLQRLRAAGHLLECVTSKPEWAEPQVWKWLGRWRPPFHRVTIVPVRSNKLDWTNAPVIIDDKRETCEEFAAAGRFAIHFTVEDLPSVPRIEVAKTWDDVVRAIVQLSLP